ncbi:MAG: serine/threonine-protein kinase, partial [Pseudomonadota bacterium]
MTQFQDQALREGVHIGVYEIKGILGATRFAITYRGWNHHLNAKVVLKEYFPHDYAVRREEGRIVAPKAENDREIYEYGLASFVEQADVLGQIQQHSVVGVHNALQINGTAYLIMDYEDGVPLSMLSDPPASMTGPKFKAILTSLLAGLEQVHARGTVHGDIHPSNILLRENGEAVLIDFAAARLAMAERSNTLAQELRAGYAAPERYDTGNRPGPESDLYALGATMYRCITHNEPAPAPERLSALGKSEADPLEPLLGSGAQIDNKDLLKTIDWMLRPQAKDRPRSATDVLAALSTEDEDVQQMGTQTKPGDKGHMAKPVESPPRTVLLVGGVIGLAALIAAGLWYFQPSEPAPDTLAFKPDIRIAPVSKAEDADATSGPAPFTDPEVPVAESPGETNSAPVATNAQRETPEPDQGP